MNVRQFCLRGLAAKGAPISRETYRSFVAFTS